MDQFQATQRKFFPWVHAIQKEFMRSFPRDYDYNTLQRFYKCIEDELVGPQTHSRRRALFETLVQFYHHFCLKIKWDEPCPDMKEACVRLLASVIRVGVELSSRDPAAFCNRVISAVKMFPGEDSLLYAALLQVTHLKKKFHQSYAIILKQVLFSSHLVLTKPEVYLKVVFLLRRLKSILGDQTEKTKVHVLASGLKPPHNTLQWISLHCPGLSGTKALGNELMAKKLPLEVYRKLREVLLPGLVIKQKTFHKEKKLKEPESFVIDASPRAENDLETQTANCAECSNSSSKRASSRKRKAFSDESEWLSPISNTDSIKKAKKTQVVCENRSDSDSESLNYNSVEVEGTPQGDIVHGASPVSATLSSNTGSKKKARNKKKKKREITDNIVETGLSVVQNDDSISKEESERRDSDEMSQSEWLSQKPFSSTDSIKKAKKTRVACENRNDSDSLNYNSVELEGTPQGDIVYVASQVSATLSSNTGSKKKVKNKKKKKREITDNIVETGPSVVRDDDSLSKEESDLVQDDDSLSKAESDLEPFEKSQRLLPTESQLDTGGQNNRSICYAEEKLVNEVVAGKTSSSEKYLVKTFAPIRKSRKLRAVDIKMDSETKSLDQNETSTIPADSKQENEDTNAQTSSTEDSLVAPTRKSKRLHAVDIKMDSETKSLDQNETSTTPVDGKQENEDANAQTLSAEERLVASTRKSKRLHAVDIKMDFDTKSLDQNETSASPADSKQKNEDEDSQIWSTQEDFIPSSVPTRKSKRLQSVKNELDSETKLLDRNEAAACPLDCKQENEGADSQTFFNDTRKSKRLQSVISELDSKTKRLDQNQTSSYPEDSKQENEDMDAKTCPVAEHLVQISSDIKIELNSETKYMCKNETSTFPTDSELEMKLVGIQTLSTTSEHLIPSSSPVRKNRSPIVESKLNLSVEIENKVESIDFTSVKQDENRRLMASSSTQESSVKSSHSPVRKSKRLLAMEDKSLSEVENSDQIPTTEDPRSVGELHSHEDQLEEVSTKVHPTGKSSRDTRSSSGCVLSKVKEEHDFQVVETDTGYKIMGSFKQRPSFENSSNISESDVLKTSTDSPTSCQNIPVVVISPAENAGLCVKYDTSALDDRLLHPSNCIGSYSTPINGKRPDIGERVPPQLNESKPCIESKSSEPRNHSSLKAEDSPVKCHYNLRTPVGNKNAKSLHESDVKVEASLVADVQENAFKENAVVDKILTSIENAEPVKLVSLKTAATCNRSTLGAVPGMTFSPFIRKAKHYLTFSDVTQENEPSQLLRDETRGKQTENEEFSDYRDFEDDVCDNKSEGVMSDIGSKIDHVSSDASVCDSNNEDSEDVASLPGASEIESSQESTCFGLAKESSPCPEPIAEGKEEQNQTESNDCSSPVSSGAIEENDPGRTASATAADIGISGEGSRADAPAKNLSCDRTSLPVGEEVSLQPTVDIVRLTNIETDQQCVRPPSKRLRSKKTTDETPKEKKKENRKKKGSTGGSASSGYSLRRTTRSKAAEEHVELGLNFNKLNLGAPSAPMPPKKVTFKVEEAVQEEEEDDAKPSKRATRSSSQMSESSSQSLKPKEPALTTEGPNLRRSKRSVVLPGKLKLK